MSGGRPPFKGEILLDLSNDTLDIDESRKQLITEAAQNTKSHLLIVLSTWNCSNPARDFDALSKFITQVYTIASANFASRNEILLPVDLVILSLRERDSSSLPLIQEVFPAASFSLVLEESSLRTVEEGSLADVKLDPSGVFGTVALGGTFDHLHPGHKILLTMSAWIAKRRVIVGITDEALLTKKKNKDLLESLDERRRAVSNFIRLIGPPSLQLDLPALQDVYGPTATEADCQAMVVSQETIGGGEAVDKKRKEENLPPLRTFVIGVLSPDTSLTDLQDQLQAKMSSTAIREWLAAGKQQQTPKL